MNDHIEYCDLKEPVHLKAPPLKKSTSGSLVKSSFKRIKSSFKRLRKQEPAVLVLDETNNSDIDKIIEPSDPDVDLLLRVCDSVNELKQHNNNNVENIIYYLTPLLSNLNEALHNSTEQPLPPHDESWNELSNDILTDDEILNVFNLYDKMLKTAFSEEQPVNERTRDLSNNNYNSSKIDNGAHETSVIISEGSTNEIGVTIVKENQSIVISRILKNSLAEKTGQLSVGDEIIEINKIPIKGLSIEDVLNVLNQEKSHGLTFLIKSRMKLEKNLSFCVDTGCSIKNESKYVKALFNYSVERDEQARCKEIGLNFAMGDILEVVDRSDMFYWQAKKVIKNNDNYTTDDNTKIGLIPSRNYYQNVLKSVLNDSDGGLRADYDNSVNCFSCFQSSDKFQSNSSTLEHNSLEKYECGYQDIILISPDPFNCRPVFLISSSIEELDVLVDSLIKKRPHICQRPTLYTTKQSKRHQTPEINGINEGPQVVSKYSFERAINHHQFIGVTHTTHSYGYSIKDIWSISQQGKICLIPTESCNLDEMYKSGLRPFLVFVKVGVQSQFSQKAAKNINKELQKVVPFMDEIVEHNSLDDTVKQLESVVLNTLNNPLWVPVASEVYQK